MRFTWSDHLTTKREKEWLTHKGHDNNRVAGQSRERENRLKEIDKQDYGFCAVYRRGEIFVSLRSNKKVNAGRFNSIARESSMRLLSRDEPLLRDRERTRTQSTTHKEKKKKKKRKLKIGSNAMSFLVHNSHDSCTVFESALSFLP